MQLVTLMPFPCNEFFQMQQQFCKIVRVAIFYKFFDLFIDRQDHRHI